MFSNQYINMCREAKDELEYVKVFNENREEFRKFAFRRGDYFHHPELKADEVKKVAKVDERNIRAVDDPKPFRKEVCIWVPTADQLLEETGQIPYNLLMKEDLKKYYEDHFLSDLSDEERVLSYFMEHRHKKTWDIESQKWTDLKLSK